ncbi:Pentatricopeptide repeat-containing protein [Artemisia annua]|uniref:Pentatricopeptide repeat-containing protein n=1 Tax=Artemisia annua TaxID=35608 RepID=A0A2U1Q4E0_ARTAN|nr:Pentatricopeptide repeat-containing protein [Artemisia annua]
MSVISSSKPHFINPNFFSNLARITNTHHRFNPLSLFCTSITPNEEHAQIVVPPTESSQPDTNRVRPTRGNVQNHEKIESLIARMMSNRAWTTRLQNSIRNLVPVFDHDIVYNVLHSCEKKPDIALQFFRWVERAGLFKHDQETTSKMIEILGNSGKLNHARCILLDMPKKGLKWNEDLFVVLIDSYGKAGIVQESVKIFRSMEELGVARSIKSYDVLFKVIMRRGRYMMAKRYFNKMLSEGIVPTRHTYNVMIWGFFLSKRIGIFYRFFEDMKSREILPDVVTYNIIINGFIRGYDTKKAEEFFVEMKSKNIEPTVVTYTTMIKGHVEIMIEGFGMVKDADNALKLFEEMKGLGIKPNAITYSALLTGLCKADKMTDAHNILNEMVHRHIAPLDNSIFLKLISGQCKAGNLEAAADVLKSMMRLNVTPEAGHYGVLIENLCKSNVYEEAVKLVDQLIDNEIVLNTKNTLDLESTAYNPIIEYLCDNGMTSKAETLFRQLMKLGVLDPVGFNVIIRGHSKEGNPESGFELLKIMMRRNVASEESAYKLLVESYLKKNEPAYAKTALDGMIENGHKPDSALFRSVMGSLFEDGRVQTASRVMKDMVEMDVKEDMDLISKILEALLLRGHVEEALGRIELLMNAGFAPDIDSLLSVVCEKGKTIPAVKLLNYALERDYSVEYTSYDKVLDALLAAGKTLNAYSILCKIKEKGGVTDESSGEELIKLLNEQGNTKQGDILSRMIKGTGSKKTKKQAPIAA